jgi:hypothetical protein
MTSSRESRLPVRAEVLTILELAGWVGVVGGVVLSLVYATNLSAGWVEQKLGQTLLALFPGIGLWLGGFLVGVISETARVFIVVESNTYKLGQQSLPDS